MDTAITCSVSPCTVVLQFADPLLSLSVADATQVAISIGAAWALGFCIRAVIRVIHTDVSSTESE